MNILCNINVDKIVFVLSKYTLESSIKHNSYSIVIAYFIFLTGKEVMKKRGNIRDSFQKSEKQQKALKKSGSRKVTPRTYIYGPQLQFLKKTFQERMTDDSLSYDSQQQIESTNISQQEDSLEDTHSTLENDKRQGDNFNFKTPKYGKRKTDPIELELMSVIKEKPDRHLSFFRGIIPSLNSFSEDEILEFQMNVLQTIKSIKQRKTMLSTQNVSVSQISHVSQHATSLRDQTYTNLAPQTYINQETVNANMDRQQSPYLDFHSPLRRTGQYIEQDLSNSPSTNNISESSYDSFDFSV